MFKLQRVLKANEIGNKKEFCNCNHGPIEHADMNPFKHYAFFENINGHQVVCDKCSMYKYVEVEVETK